MLVTPAVDVLGGRAVRLHQGDYSRVTEYGNNPISVAQGFVADGCELVHVVDLEAARNGHRSLEVLSSLSAAAVPFQLGGGIRGPEEAVFTIESGAVRVVVGSVLLSGPSTVEEIVSAVGPSAVVGAIDVRGGRARGSGWLDAGAVLEDVLATVSEVGLERVLVTGIDADGTMAGPSWSLLARVRETLPDVALIASGGVGSLRDLEALADSMIGFEAAIVGRALYERRFTLPEAIAAAS
jgi:phosphoribosylformimino-5-aminoimidazole carboxamide ribotide isomerase